MGSKSFIASVRDHRTGETSTATGTTEASTAQQAKANVQAAVRQLPGVKTATRIDLH